MKSEEKYRINLQLFAGEPGETDPEVDKKPEPGETDPPGGNKTFTQEEVNAMMAKEKNQGKLSILKELGVDDAKSAKEALAKYKEYLDSQKTEAERLADTLKGEQEAKTAAELKAQQLERKFDAIEAGVPADKAEDIVILAAAKVTETKDFKTALEEVKTAYPQLFEASSNGTGSNAGSRKTGGSNKGTLGSRLAENAAKNQSKSTNYFTN